MKRENIISDPRLSSVALFLDIEGEAWGGFTAEKETIEYYTLSDWPGLKTAIKNQCQWGDCIQETVKPYYGQLHIVLSNQWGAMQTIVKELRLGESV